MHPRTMGLWNTVVLTLVLVLVTSISQIEAASSGSVSWTGTGTNGAVCADSTLNMTITWLGTVNDYSGSDWIAVVTEDAAGDPLDIGYFGMPLGSSIPTGNYADLSAFNEISMRPVTVTLYDVGNPTSVVPVYGVISQESYTFATSGTNLDADTIDPAIVVSSCQTVPGNRTRTIMRLTNAINDVHEFYRAADAPFNLFRWRSPRGYIGANNQGYGARTGLRFTNVTIPRGATITEAYLEVYSLSNQVTPVSASIYADRSANSAQFSSQSRPSSRRLTSHHADLSTGTTPWRYRRWVRITGLSPVVQEIVSMNGWGSGNSLSLILKSPNTPYGMRSFATTEGGHSPRLTITFNYASG